MRIAGCDNQLPVFFTQCNNLAVEIAQCFLVCDPPLFNQKTVIADWLYFQIIIKVHNCIHFRLRTVVKQRLYQLSRFTCRSDNQAFTVLFQFGLRNTRVPAEIFQITVRNQLVQVFQAGFVFDKNNLVVRLQLQRIRIFGHFLNQMFISQHVPRFQVGNHTKINVRKHIRIIRGTVMVEVPKIVMRCNGIQLMIFQCRIQVT